jgi:DNA (cytosine-5)-methyltransferase 1
MHGEAPKTKQRNAKQKTIHAVDLFCGAGGTSTGLIDAVNSLGYSIKLTAINHWDVAIATHSKNHEEVEHFCQSIDTVNPNDVVKGGRLQLLVASPECTHHSNARGGKPMNDQKRADAWLLLRWIQNLYVENILIENVAEFLSWGPLGANNRPLKRQKGATFKAFIDTLRITYNVEYRILNCADYGDPTTRKRLFIMARRPKHKPIVWPTRTHASRQEIAEMALQPDLFNDEANRSLKPWVAARDIIDWDLKGKSIFGRKKPLSPNTMRRIFAGLGKYSLKPFIVPQFSQHKPKDVEEPLGALTTTSRGVGVCESIRHWSAVRRCAPRGERAGPDRRRQRSDWADRGRLVSAKP